jgi:D-alanyl-D-alanine carboxypeptidase
MRALTTGRAVSKESFQQMTTPAPNLPGTPTGSRYGLGIYLWHIRGAIAIGHTGQINGFTSAVMFLPEYDITVVVLANDDTFDARTAGRRLAAIALGKPYPEVATVQSSDEDLRAFAGTYQINGETVETLSISGGTFFAQRGGGHKIPLQMTACQQLHFIPDELSYFVPVRGSAGQITGIDYFQDGDGPPRLLQRIGQVTR